MTRDRGANAQSAWRLPYKAARVRGTQRTSQRAERVAAALIRRTREARKDKRQWSQRAKRVAAA